MTSLTKLFSSSGAAAERPGSCGAEASLLAPAPIFVRIAYRWAAIAFCAAMLAATLACSNENKAAATKQQVVVDPNIFTVDHPELFQTVKVETRDLPTELNSNGTVQPDVNKTIRVTSLGSGRVADLKVRLGDSVKKGQVLLIISSPDLAGALGDYQKAGADEQLARKALERAELLYSHGAIRAKGFGGCAGYRRQGQDRSQDC